MCWHQVACATAGAGWTLLCLSFLRIYVAQHQGGHIAASTGATQASHSLQENSTAVICKRNNVQYAEHTCQTLRAGAGCICFLQGIPGAAELILLLA